eukprot:TRINITY_DN19150_c0_g1_i1.p1 TRINITY_DN19150_c0_g1~~TRINITY_DN19150_c0_g1_i1.p1  ORF type:complete len:299 (+),score=32.43 TRINITY_DN19150_c0_g1_i1:129-1025(+)
MAVEYQQLDLDEALPRLHANDPTLLHLYIACNMMADQGPQAQRLANALQDNTVLKGLYLVSNGLGAVGAGLIAKALRGKKLRVLNMRHNNIGDKGVGRLIELLRDNMELKNLYLDNNEIGNEAAGRLAEWLGAHTGLEVLTLNDNPRIATEGVELLANALRGNTTLKELHLQVGLEGARQLSDMLQINTTLQKLYLQGSLKERQSRVYGMKLLADGLQGNVTLEVLELDWGLKVPAKTQQLLDRNCRLKRKALQHRRMVFFWCAQMGGGLPVEIIEVIMRQSVWDCQLLPVELRSFLK